MTLLSVRNRNPASLRPQIPDALATFRVFISSDDFNPHPYRTAIRDLLIECTTHTISLSIRNHTQGITPHCHNNINRLHSIVNRNLHLPGMSLWQYFAKSLPKTILHYFRRQIKPYPPDYGKKIPHSHYSTPNPQTSNCSISRSSGKKSICNACAKFSGSKADSAQRAVTSELSLAKFD